MLKQLGPHPGGLRWLGVHVFKISDPDAHRHPQVRFAGQGRELPARRWERRNLTGEVPISVGWELAEKVEVVRMVKKYGDIMLSGKSGHKYCFQAWPFGTRFRPLGAVFFVTKRLFNNKNYRRASHEVLYIGETSSMAEPLASLFQLDAFEKRGANCVCVYPTTDEAQRRTMLEDLVAGHSPAMQG